MKTSNNARHNTTVYIERTPARCTECTAGCCSQQWSRRARSLYRRIYRVSISLAAKLRAYFLVPADDMCADVRSSTRGSFIQQLFFFRHCFHVGDRVMCALRPTPYKSPLPSNRRLSTATGCHVAEDCVHIQRGKSVISF
jgi:hypothetical protein